MNRLWNLQSYQGMKVVNSLSKATIMCLLKRILCVSMLLIFCLQYIYAQTTTRLSELNVLVGSWNVKAENRLSANGPWETNNTAVDLAKAEKIFKKYNPQYPFEYTF